MKKFLIAVVLMLGVVFVITRFTEINQIVDVLQRGRPLYLVLALLVQLCWLYNMSGFFQAIYSALEMRDNRLHLLHMVTAANFLNIVAPSGGLSGLAIFISNARRQGRSTARVTIAGILYVWFDYWTTLLLLVLGLGDLQSRGALHWAETTAALLLLGMALAISVLLVLGMQSAQKLGTLLSWGARAANFVSYPFVRHHSFNPEKAYNFAQEIAEGISILRYKSNWVLLPFLYALLNKLLLVVVLALCFLAFSVKVEIGSIVAGLGLAQLFLIISPTPSGLGIVEGVLTVALTTLGVPLSDAAVITLAYRAFSFWFPFLAGLVAFRTLEHRNTPPRPTTAHPKRTVEG